MSQYENRISNLIDGGLIKEKETINKESDSFYSLIDRLQAHSEWKYPNRKWNNDAYYGIAFQWKGKEKELKERVLRLEQEMFHKSKPLTIEEVEQGRSNAYKYLDL